MNIFRIPAALAACVALAFPVRSAEPENLVGLWSGKVMLHEKAVDRIVALQFDWRSRVAGADVNTLQYFQPRGCRLSAEYAGATPSGHQFSFKTSSGGGFCDRMVSGFAVLRPGAGGLDLSLYSDAGDLVEQTALVRAAAPAH